MEFNYVGVKVMKNDEEKIEKNLYVFLGEKWRRKEILYILGAFYHNSYVIHVE